MHSHPLKNYAQSNKVTLDQIAVAANTSRMTLNRVMRGENTTLDLLRRISLATGGAVTIQSLVESYNVAAVATRPVPSSARAAHGGAA